MERFERLEQLTLLDQWQDADIPFWPPLQSLTGERRGKVGREKTAHPSATTGDSS